MPSASLSRRLAQEVSAQSSNSEPFLAVEAFGGRDEQQPGIGKRHIADAQVLGHFSSSAAVMIERAISAIFLPSFIATLRIIA